MGSISYSDTKHKLLGQNGSVFVKVGNSPALSGQVFVAITFTEASVFESGSTGLVPETTYRFPSSTEGATLIVSSYNWARSSYSTSLHIVGIAGETMNVASTSDLIIKIGVEY